MNGRSHLSPSLQGQVVVVTGGGQGMGRAHALSSAEAGADVVIMDRLEPESPEMRETAEMIRATGRQALTLQVDVTSQDSLNHGADEALKQFGRVDAVIVNAGLFGAESLLEATDALWTRIIEVNLTGAWRTVRAFAPVMVQQRSGSFVFIASVNGVEPHLGYTAYSASKFGVIGLMQNTALELGAHNIRANAVLPGIIETPMAASLRGDRSDDEILRDRQRNVALTDVSFLYPEDVAAAGVYLNSSMARGVTGVSLPVDSGHLILPGVNSLIS